MQRASLFLFAIFLSLMPAAGAESESAAAPDAQTESAASTPPAVVADTRPDPLLSAIQAALDSQPASPPSDDDTRHPAVIEVEASERAALDTFYRQTGGKPLWIDGTSPNGKAEAAVALFKAAGRHALDPAAFALSTPVAATLQAADRSMDDLARLEVALSTKALLYARHARGGRIMKPSEMLNSNLDRRPQLVAPAEVLAGLASASDVGAYLEGLNPQHPQYVKLRNAFETLGGAAAIANGKPLSTTAKRLRTNMEQWRWMSPDMGDMHVLNNVPEFMQYVYKDGRIVRSEKIVAGMLDKQSSIFSRPLKHVVLRPQWRVPESIMVHELWPSLRRGGGLMRQHGLSLVTKEGGKPVDWRHLDWSREDIRNYHVLQPPGGASVLGVVKFSFPSQHTIFMHDTPDKWMFRSTQRTLSHGCLRVKNPVELAEIVLMEDKGWDKAKVAELIRSGPLNNEVQIDKRIPIHLTYFTAWISDDGKQRAFGDIYGHERRITQALDGQWTKINKGRDHLAPPQPRFNPKAPVPVANATGGKPRKAETAGDFLSEALGLNF
ncbi:MAG: L,D-transpeptidase family protein [Hyphomicrobium sp.]